MNRRTFLKASIISGAAVAFPGTVNPLIGALDAAEKRTSLLLSVLLR